MTSQQERRKFIRNTFVAGAGLALFSSKTIDAITSSVLQRYDSGTLQRYTFFDSDQFLLVSNLVDHLLPETDSPSASMVGVPYFIDMMLEHIYSVKERDNFVQGLSKVVDYYHAQYKKTFSSLSLYQKNRLFDTLDQQMERDILADKRKEGEKTFFMLLKEAALYGYVSHQKIAKEYMYYEPFPGSYHGCVPLEVTQGKRKSIHRVADGHVIKHAEWLD